MKIILQDGRRVILRFDKGEEAIDGLAKFAKENKIFAAYFSAIGSCSSFELGFYNGFLKQYRHKPFLNDSEIISLTGNISGLNSEPVVHAHGVFSGSDFEIVGGHVFKIAVAATCEVFLIKLEGEMKRDFDKDMNLNLLV